MHSDQALKECADEIDLGTQYHLTRYAFLSESIVLNDASTLVPVSIEDGQYHISGFRTMMINQIASASPVGLKAAIESIDNRSDFKTYMQNYAYARGGSAPKGPRREGPADEGFVSHPVFFVLATTHSPIFSYHLYQPMGKGCRASIPTPLYRCPAEVGLPLELIYLNKWLGIMPTCRLLWRNAAKL